MGCRMKEPIIIDFSKGLNKKEWDKAVDNLPVSKEDNDKMKQQGKE